MIISRNKTIWIDFDNSPHVPFFHPIIRRLGEEGYSFVLTGRECFQVRGLAGMYNLECEIIGRHYGKNKLLKVIGFLVRAIQLAPVVLRQRPDLALSHGSRSQILISRLLRIPSLALGDYEYTRELVAPTWCMMPDIVPSEVIPFAKGRIFKYPGIKEDVYVPYFKPDDSLINKLGLKKNGLIITIRPPATEAHYFSAKSEELFESAMDFLCKLENIQLVLLPRSEKQKAFVNRRWASWIGNGKITIPKHAIDGLNLIWHSDLVISGGGTMNREAAALGVPVYSIFRGKIGAVDRYLSEQGRLVLIENKDQLYSKIVLSHRDKTFRPSSSDNLALQKIVSQIVNIIEGRYV